MFNITEDSFGTLTQIELNNVITGEYATIIHDYGTAINELVLESNGKKHSILRSTNTHHDMVGKNWFKGAKLFPFPNRIKDGLYTFNGKEYKLAINEEARHNALHGFVYNKPFDLVTHEEKGSYVATEMEYVSHGKTPGYPFPFLLSLVYSLSEDGFECKTTCKNTGKEPMPMGDGWHPYFKTGISVDKLQLLLPKGKELLCDDRLIPTGKTKAFTKFDSLALIGNQQFDTAFELDVDGDIATTELVDTVNNLKISLWQETGKNKYNFLQVYIPPDRQSIAIEPMTCAPNAFNNHQGLIVLKPGEVFSASYGVSLK